jgi:phosphatidate phosphatase APP1
MRSLLFAHRVVVFALACGGLVALGAHAGATKQARVVVYDGWGTPEGFRVSGRVLEDHGERAPRPDASALDNLGASLDALESDEVRGVDVVIHVGSATFSATTDADGVFEVVCKGLSGRQALPPGPIAVDVELAARGFSAPRATGFVHIVDGAGVALVSDVDDTVVKTHVVDKVKMAGTVLLRNARQLEPVIGAAENYVAARDAGVVAFFYLSGSPQNLYPRLRTFLDDHDFPRGPIVLKNLGDDKLVAHDEYKLSRLERLAAALPRLRFVLVGDSGERDPEIYRAFRDRHPDRVVAVVIRKVPGSRRVEPARFHGFTVVDDFYPTAQTVAQTVAQAVAAKPAAVPAAANGETGPAPPAR